MADEMSQEEFGNDDATLTNADGENTIPPIGKEASFLSTRPRFFFPCGADESVLDNFIRTAYNNKRNSISGDPSYGFLGIDDEAICPTCEIDVMELENTSRYPRSALCHTLHHGTIDIRVTDLSCGNCRRYIPYDGYADAVFCLNKMHIFTRELLDAWLWDLCGMGGTFRDVFTSWLSQGIAPSAAFHRIGREICVNRQRGNEAFSGFLKTLKFPHDDDLYSLFSCSKCERDPESGTRDLAAVVMDGTALGILGSLPKFNRETRSVSAVSRVPDKQYIMRKPKARSFVDAILTSAKGADGLDAFNVPLKIGLWKKKAELVSIVFNYGGGINHEAFVVGKFMNTCFAICDNAGSERSEDDDSDGENTVSSKVMRIRNLIPNVDVRRTAIEFGRCFAVGSIAGGVLRNSLSVDASTILIAAFQHFSACNHLGTEPGDMNCAVCESCSQKLYQEGLRAEELVAPAARMACTLAEAGMYGHGNQYRYLASVAAQILDRAMQTRAFYYQEFEKNQGEDVEFQENARSCRKHYTKSESHSPGIFTVQCVCSHPKLIGISVMQECEGVSTALSVLLARFRRLPRVCYYDNACNMSKSIILRCPWVNDDCIIVCDRFHYHGHTCNSIWDPSNYPSCRNHATSGAEAINHVWNFSKSHLRFLRPDNMMPFLAARAVFVNIRASIREFNGKTDINAKQFRYFVRNKWPCTCKRCAE